MINKKNQPLNDNIPGKGKRILITGARFLWALELSRLLKMSGHQVYACDTTAFHPAKFSNAVTKFFTCPSPRYDIQGFIDKLKKIIIVEKIDLVIPIWEEILYISQFRDQFPKSCELFCSSFQILRDLHHKWHFIKLLESLGIKSPNSVLLQSSNDLTTIPLKKPYILKKCYSRNSQGLQKVTNTHPENLPIEPDNPWIAQEFIEGNHLCSYSVCRKGKVLAHTVYPVEYTINGNSCVAFEAIEHKGVLDWVKNLMQELSFTGHIAFDFIEQPNGNLYAIECNPRGTSGIHLFKPEDHLDKAFLDTTHEMIMPSPGNSQQIAFGMLLYGLGTGASERKLPQYIKKFLTTKDVVFSSWDLKPFLFEPLVLGSYWLNSIRQRLPIPTSFMQDLEWEERLLKL